MQKRYKYFIFTVFILFLTVGQTASALEVNYPLLGGYVQSFTLPEYISYIFWFLVISAGTAGILIIAVAGVKIILNFGKPETIGEARKKIIDAILGIILLMSSVIILRTINTELVTPVSTGTLPTTGIYMIDSNGNREIAPVSSSNTAFDLKEGFTTLYYYCSNGTGPNLLVWTYDQPKYIVDAASQTVTVVCGGTLNVEPPLVLSFYRAYEEPGAYFYYTPDCTGFSSRVQKFDGNIDKVDEPYIVASVRIVSGLDPLTDYGVILNKRGNGDGECTEPLINTKPGTSQCFTVPPDLTGQTFDPYYAYILRYNPLPNPGTEVELKSQHLYATIPNDEIAFPNNPLGYYLYYADPVNGNPDKIIFDQHKLYLPGATSTECCTNEGANTNPICKDVDFQSNGACLKDIVIDGDYYVVLYSRNDEDGDRLCRVFSDDTKDIQTSTDITSEGKQLYKIAIIPQS